MEKQHMEVRTLRGGISVSSRRARGMDGIASCNKKNGRDCKRKTWIINRWSGSLQEKSESAEKVASVGRGREGKQTGSALSEVLSTKKKKRER